MTADDLRAFEADIAEEFNAGKIRAPIHLSDGNEEILIEVFKHVKPQDWVCGSWRMHYHCLLKDVPPALLKEEIMAGRSISLCLPEYRIISSAMVGGILPIAVGIAMAIKRQGGDETVWVFVGDMTAMTGTFHECYTYAVNWGLPMRFIVEENRLSVCSPTRAVWNSNGTPPLRLTDHTYEYESRFPHAGAGKRIQF